MFENELQDLRRYKWRVDSPTRAVFTADDAREFLHNVGFCLEYPLRAPVLAPTFIGAVIGSDENLPTAKYAFIHPRAKEATGFKDRLLREKAAFEAGFGEDDNLLISAQEFPYFYALIGDRNPKVPPSAGERGERRLLTHAFELIQQHGPILETDLRERLGETVSDVALSRTLSELRQKLRIVRIEDTGGPMWDLLMRWSPQVVNQGKQISAQEALSALVSKYLETCIAADQKEVEEFFGHIVPRSRVTEVIKALLGAREFGFIQVNDRTLLRNTPRLSAEEKAAQIAASAAPKPEGRANRSFRPRPEGEMPKKNVWEKYGPKKDKFDKRPKREDGSWIGREKPTREKFVRGKSDDAPRPGAGARFERGAAPFAKKSWKKEGPPRPWQKRPDATGGTGERSFRPTGDRPPKRFDGPREGKREWKPDDRRGGFGGKPAWKSGEGSDRGPRKFGTGAPSGPRKEWKPREGGANAAAPKRGWKKFGGEGPKKFDSGRPAAAGPRKEWKKRPDTKEFGASRFQAKFGQKKPWEKKPEAGASDAAGASEERPKTPFKKRPFAKSGSKPAPFKKAGPGGGFKKPFKKGAGGFGSKPRPRRPA